MPWCSRWTSTWKRRVSIFQPEQTDDNELSQQEWNDEGGNLECASFLHVIHEAWQEDDLVWLLACVILGCTIPIPNKYSTCDRLFCLSLVIALPIPACLMKLLVSVLLLRIILKSSTDFYYHGHRGRSGFSGIRV